MRAPDRYRAYRTSVKKGLEEHGHHAHKAIVVELKQLIKNHLSYTGSAVAERVLANWETILAQFVKVMPVDYKRVLEERKLAQLQTQNQSRVGTADGVVSASAQ